MKPLIDLSTTPKNDRGELQCAVCGAWAKTLFAVHGHYGQRPVCQKCVSKALRTE